MRWPSPRVAGWCGVAGALVLLLVAPFHAAAYFATPDGSEDLFPYQRAAGEAIRGAAATAYSDPYASYLAFGRITAAGIALLAIAFIGYHGATDADLPRRARIVGRVAAVSWVVLGAAALAEYLTPFTDQIFLVAAPSLLATIVLTAVYGWMRARHGPEPRWTAWALFAGAVAYVPLIVLFGHIPMGAYGFSAAWLAIGPRLARRG